MQRDPLLEVRRLASPLLLKRQSILRRRIVRAVPEFVALRKIPDLAHANTCAARRNNPRRRGPTAFARTTDRAPQHGLQGPDNVTKRFGWRSARLSTCV